MKIFELKITDKTVIDTVYGNGRHVYEVKFLYTLSLFNKIIRHGYMLDKIKFRTEQQASEYAKIAEMPSAHVSKSAFLEKRKIYTAYDQEIKDINVFLKKLRKNAPESILKHFHKEKISNVFYEKNLMSDSDGIYTIYNLKKTWTYHFQDSSLKELLDILFYHVQTYADNFNNNLNYEKKKNTIIETNEIRISAGTNIKKPAIADTCELDNARREFIQDELLRIDEYKKSLITLMK